MDPGGDIEIAERPRPQIAVFVELRQALSALENVSAILGIVEETASAELDETMRPPGGLDQRRSLERQIGVGRQRA